MVLTAGRDKRTDAAWRVLLVVLAVGQLISPLIVSAVGGGEFTTSDRAGEPPIVPAGYAFSIWGLVEALCVGYAVWALVTKAPGSEVRDRLARPLAVVFAGFSVWLVAAEVEPVWATVVVFLIMAAGLFKALSIALQERHAIARWARAPRTLFWTMLGVYAGWSSVAIWINLTTALAESGAPVTGNAGVAGQIAILSGATATAVVVLRWTAGLLFYGLAVAWALVAVVVATIDARQVALAALSAVALLVVVAATAWFRVRRPASSA